MLISHATAMPPSKRPKTSGGANTVNDLLDSDTECEDDDDEDLPSYFRRWQRTYARDQMETATAIRDLTCRSPTFYCRPPGS